MIDLPKRTWVYAGTPKSYGIPPCKCGNEDTVYSEFQEHLWCEKCQLDFIPEHWGIFDGPILFEVALLMGMTFDRIDLTRNILQRCVLDDKEGIKYVDEPQS